MLNARVLFFPLGQLWLEQLRLEDGSYGSGVYSCKADGLRVA